MTELNSLIDWKFIQDREGFEVKGYVPDVNRSNSGVTIASGIDLGQRSAAEINAWPISQDLKDRLLPYIGLKKYTAEAALKGRPLVITKDEAMLLNSIIKKEHVNSLRNSYNTSIKSGMRPFDSLPPQAQTVIASVSFQYGSLSMKCPSFWRCAIAQDWEAMVKELRNFGDAYAPRRNLEADYLMPLLKK